MTSSPHPKDTGTGLGVAGSAPILRNMSVLPQTTYSRPGARAICGAAPDALNRTLLLKLLPASVLSAYFIPPFATTA